MKVLTRSKGWSWQSPDHSDWVCRIRKYLCITSTTNGVHKVTGLRAAKFVITRCHDLWSIISFTKFNLFIILQKLLFFKWRWDYIPHYKRKKIYTKAKTWFEYVIEHIWYNCPDSPFNVTLRKVQVTKKKVLRPVK